MADWVELALRVSRAAGPFAGTAAVRGQLVVQGVWDILAVQVRVAKVSGPG